MAGIEIEPPEPEGGMDSSSFRSIPSDKDSTHGGVGAQVAVTRSVQIRNMTTHSNAAERPRDHQVTISLNHGCL
jgi:hypothetical protein